MIKPLNNHIQIEVIKDDGIDGGIITHTKNNVIAEQGKVLAIPKDYTGEVKVGDVILFKNYSLITFQETKYNQEYNFVIADEIVAVLA